MWDVDSDADCTRIVLMFEVKFDVLLDVSRKIVYLNFIHLSTLC